MSGWRRAVTWLGRWAGAVQITCGLTYLIVYFVINGSYNHTLALVLGLLLIVIGTSSLITRVRADRRRQRDQPTTDDPARRGVDL